MDSLPSEPQTSVHSMQAYINDIQTIEDTNRIRSGDVRGMHSKYSALNSETSNANDSAEPPTVKSRIPNGPTQPRKFEKAGEQDLMNSPPITPRFNPRLDSLAQENQSKSPSRTAIAPNLHIGQIPFRTRQAYRDLWHVTTN